MTPLESLPFNSGTSARLWVLLAAFAPFLAPGPNAQSPAPRSAPAAGGRPACPAQSSRQPGQSSPAARAMNTEMYQTPMEVAVYQLHNFNISFFSSLLGGDVVSVKLDNR